MHMTQHGGHDMLAVHSAQSDTMMCSAMPTSMQQCHHNSGNSPPTSPTDDTTSPVTVVSGSIWCGPLLDTSWVNAAMAHAWYVHVPGVRNFTSAMAHS
jgi:hypothetical protein